MLVFFSVTPAFSQMNTAEVSGLVTDSMHASIPDAAVVAFGAETQGRFTSTTNDAGEYLLSQIPPGEYTLTVSAQGFQKAVQEHFVLHVNDRAREDFSLRVGDIAQSMIVQIVPGAVQTESAEIKDVVQNQQVVDLPLKSRQFLQLTLLSEGVVNPPGGTRGDALQQTGSLINVLGQRTGHNLFLVDGVSVTDEYFNNVVLNPSPDEIQEFMIDKTDYDAEFGGRSGAVVNIVTRSGANRLHGSLYEFVRNNILDARNFFDPAGPAPALRGNQFGAATGGPVIKDSTFFFANYDGQRVRSTVADLFNVPTLAQRAGNFSGGPAIHYPGTTTPIPGNNLASDPTLHLDPAAVALLNMLPAPTPGLTVGGDLRSVGKGSMDDNQYNARLDRRFSDRDSGTLRASAFDALESDPFGSSVLNETLLPGFGRDLATHSVNLAVAETHTFSSSLVNEARFGWLQVSGGQTDPNAGNPFASQYGLQGLTPNQADQGFPQISLNGSFTTIGSPTYFISRTDRNFELFDNVLIHHGSHSVQFGGYLFHLDFNPRLPNDARGLYTYNGAYTGNALADFLLGYPSQAQVGIGEGAENAHTNWAQFYVEDGWQIKPSLKINAGLRYEYNADLVAQPNQTSGIDLAAPDGPAFVVAGNPASLPAAASALAALSPIPIVSAAGVGWDSSLLTPRYLRFSPRVGVAWRVPGSRDTVVRAGFGVYTNQAAYSILQALAENMPFFLVKTVANSTSTPSFSTENILAQNPNGAIGANGVNHDYRIEYNEVWNLTVQRAISANTTLEAEYIGSRTVHADSSTAVNVPETFGGPRPYPSLAAFTTIRWDGWATFNGITLKVTRRFARGLSFDADYTLSHSIDDASDTGTTNAEYNLPQNVYAPSETASSSFDHRNRFTANAVYDLPFTGGTNRTLRATLGGWRASGILTIQSGAPFTVNLPSGDDVAHIGLVNGNNIERPNLVGDPNDGPKTAAEWFNVAAFTVPSQDTFGTAGRNVVIGPGLEGLDVSLQKEWSVRESMALQFRVDAFNALNHSNFNLPGRIYGASNFGVVTSAQDPRQLQIAAKFVF